MINHVRTLILNKNGSGRQDSSFYLEEFIDPLFRSIDLDPRLKAAQEGLVEPDADAAFANFRMMQYMRVLHATEFAAYVTALDPRVTYLHEPDPPYKSNISVEQRLGGTPAPLSFTGEVVASHKTPFLLNSWTLTATDTSHIVLTHDQTQAETTEQLTFANGVSSVFTLPDQASFRVRVLDSQLHSGQEWYVKTFTQPSDDLSDTLVRLAELDADALNAVFPNRAPYTIFRDLFEKNAILSYRLSGFLLAFAYRAEELRNA